MTDIPLTAADRDDLAARFGEVTADVADELGGAPALAELLDVLKWSVPPNSDALDGSFQVPCPFTATLSGNKRYRPEGESRVPELNDDAFEQTREILAALAEKLQRGSGSPVAPQDFAAGLAQVLRAAGLELADTNTAQLRRLATTARKRRITLAPGDVLAIPVPAGYRLAVVITRNRFGTALGLFDGTTPSPRPSTDVLRRPRTPALYTEESRAKDGTWPVVHHDEELLANFPESPEVHHAPGAWPGIDTGEHGAAETGEGTMRFIDAAEAREVGLADGSYRQTRTAADLQKQLSTGTGDP